MMKTKKSRIVDMLNEEYKSSIRNDFQRAFHETLLNILLPSIYDDEAWCICGNPLVLDESKDSPEETRPKGYCSASCELKHAGTKEIDPSLEELAPFNLDNNNTEFVTDTSGHDESISCNPISVPLKTNPHSFEVPSTNQIGPFPEGTTKQCFQCNRTIVLNEAPHFKKDRYGNFWCSNFCLFDLKDERACMSEKLYRDTIASLSIIRSNNNVNEGV